MKLLFFVKLLLLSLFLLSGPAHAGGSSSFVCSTNNCPKSTYQEMPMKCSYSEHSDVLECDFGGTTSTVNGAQKCLDAGGRIIAVASARIKPHVKCLK